MLAEHLKVRAPLFSVALLFLIALLSTSTESRLIGPELMRRGVCRSSEPNYRALMRQPKYRSLPKEFTHYEEKFKEFYDAQQQLETMGQNLRPNPYYKQSKKILRTLGIVKLKICLDLKLLNTITINMIDFPKFCCALRIFKFIRQCRDEEDVKEVTMPPWLPADKPSTRAPATDQEPTTEPPSSSKQTTQTPPKPDEDATTSTRKPKPDQDSTSSTKKPKPDQDATSTRKPKPKSTSTTKSPSDQTGTQGD